MIKRQESTHEWGVDRAGRREVWTQGAPFLPRLHADLRLWNGIRLPSLPLAQNIQWPPTLFTVTTDIFHMTHRPLGGVPFSAFPPDSTSYRSAIPSPVMLAP